MKYTLITVAAAVLLTGCAANKEYILYAETQQKIAQANAQAHAMAESARYAALAEIAKNGDPASRVAAAMSLSFAGNNNNGGNRALQTPQVNPPRNWQDTALQWTSVLLPAVTQMYGIAANRDVAITQSNNMAAVSQSTNNTMLGMANAHNATATAGFNANAATASSGFSAVQNTSASGFTAVTNATAAGFNAATAIAGSIKPNITITGNTGTSINAGNSGGTSTSGATTYQPLSGTGVIGSGAYSFSDTRNMSTTTTTKSTDSRNQATTTNSNNQTTTTDSRNQSSSTQTTNNSTTNNTTSGSTSGGSDGGSDGGFTTGP